MAEVLDRSGRSKSDEPARHRFIRECHGFAMTLPETACELVPGDEGQIAGFADSAEGTWGCRIGHHSGSSLDKELERIRVVLRSMDIVDLTITKTTVAGQHALQVDVPRPHGMPLLRLYLVAFLDSCFRVGFMATGETAEVVVEDLIVGFELFPADPMSPVPPWVAVNLGMSPVWPSAPEGARKEIVLIGPVVAGKSTVGRLLAHAQAIPLADIDSIERYRREAGRPFQEFQKRARAGYFDALLWSASGNIRAVERAVEDYRNCVFHFNVARWHHASPGFESVRVSLSSFKNVVLLLPDPDPTLSIEILKERSLRQRGSDWVREGYDFFEHWVRDELNYELANHVVYTEGRSPRETRDEILRLAT